METDAFIAGFALAWLLATPLIMALYFYHRTRRYCMSKTPDLTAAVQANTVALNNLAAKIGNLTANQTPDAEVQPQIDQINANTAQINSLLP